MSTAETTTTRRRPLRLTTPRNWQDRVPHFTELLTRQNWELNIDALTTTVRCKDPEHMELIRLALLNAKVPLTADEEKMTITVTRNSLNEARPGIFGEQGPDAPKRA